MSNFLYAVEREFDLPVDMLWAAWTDPVALEEWYHGTDHRVLPGSMRSDAVEGGIWTVGQVQGIIHDIPTCEVLVTRIVQEAEHLIRERLARLCG